MAKQISIIKISNNHEYVLDTSVLMSSILNYAELMRKQSPDSEEDYDHIHEVCFIILSELNRASIALDTDKIIKGEYEEKVFGPFPNEFPSQWFVMMEKLGKIKPKKITINVKHKAQMKKYFGLSKVDCCLIHVAEETSSKQVLHRETGLLNAAGYARQHFGVKTVNVMKQS